MSNVNGDLLDEGLQGVMGKDRCQNDWYGSKKADDSKREKKEARKDKPVEAQWEPVKEKPNHMDKLKACAKDALLYGALALLFFYFQQTGQMLPSAALPCICACCILLGLGVGKNAR